MNKAPSARGLRRIAGAVTEPIALRHVFDRIARLCAALLVLTCAIAATAPSAPLVQVMETDGRIAFTTPVSATAKASVTFRVQRSNASVKEISFLPTDFVAASGKRIPRQKISVAAGAVEADAKDFKIVVDGIDTLGQFNGQLLVRSPQVPTGVQAIDVAITVSPNVTTAFATETPKLKLQIAQACDPFTRFVLGSSHCPGTFALAYTKPAATLDPNVDLLLVDANNSAVTLPDEGTTPAVSILGDKIFIHFAEGKLSAGRYSGRVRATFAATGEQIQAPVEVDVRVAAGLPTLLIIAGILVGRLQSLMTSSGNAVLAASRRLERVRVRTSDLWLEARMALSATTAQIVDAVAARDMPLATQMLTKQEACLRVLETAQPLTDIEPYASDPKRFEPQLSAILAAVRINDDAAASTALAAFVKAVTPQPAAIGQPQIASVVLGGAGSTRRKAVGVVRNNFGWLRDLYLLSFVQKAMFLLLVTLLGAAGLGTLYISNGTILGASPLADYATLFAWGLTADVASRTLTNAKA